MSIKIIDTHFWQVTCKYEPGYPSDQYAVAVCKGDGLLAEIFSSIFIRLRGIIYCKVSEPDLLSAILLQKRKITGKLLQLQANLQKLQEFSTMNDTVLVIHLS